MERYHRERRYHRVAPQPSPKVTVQIDLTSIDGLLWNVSRHGMGIFLPGERLQSPHLLEEAIFNDLVAQVEVEGLGVFSGAPRWYGSCDGSGLATGLEVEDPLPEIDGIDADQVPLPVRETRTQQIPALTSTGRSKVAENIRLERSVFADAPVGLCHISAERRLLVVNREFVELLGYERPEDLLGRRTPALYADPADAAQIFERVHREQTVRNVQARLRRADGSVVWMRINGRGVRDPLGRFLGVHGTIEDATGERTAIAEASRKV